MILAQTLAPDPTKLDRFDGWGRGVANAGWNSGVEWSMIGQGNAREESGKMANTAKSEQRSQSAIPPDPYPPYRRVYAWVFQSWLVMFLGVICAALVFYLLSYIPRSS
jgi:hypothetical protein